MKHKAFGFSLVYLLLFFASPILAQFGPLPPDEKSHWTMHNAREIILLLLAHPASIRDLIPDGVSPRTAAERAADDPRLQAHLAKHPEQGTQVFTVLEIVRADSVNIDGHVLDGAFAVWLAGADPSGTGDDRALGYNWIFLDYWLPDIAVVTHMSEQGVGTSYAKLFRVATEQVW